MHTHVHRHTHTNFTVRHRPGLAFKASPALLLAKRQGVVLSAHGKITFIEREHGFKDDNVFQFIVSDRGCHTLFLSVYAKKGRV